MNVSRMTFSVAVAALMLLLPTEPVLAHGHSYGYNHYFHRGYHSAGHGSVRVGVGYGYGHGRRYRGHRRHRHGSNVSFAISAPLYVPYHRDTVVVREQRLQAPRPRALPNMPTLTYVAREQRDAAALTRDRRECERWAWRRTRPDPRGAIIRTVHTDRVVTSGGYSESILHPAASGAALGAIGGAIGGDVGAGAAIGALVGATSWLLSGGAAPRHERVRREVQVSEYVPAGGPDPYALRQALVECMQARDYSVEENNSR